LHPSSFEWNDVVWIIVFVVVVALFLGPGMWSSSTNTLAKDLWLKWRAQRRPDARQANGEDPPEDEAVTGTGDRPEPPDAGQGKVPR
jgi:hypothetical protein